MFIDFHDSHAASENQLDDTKTGYLEHIERHKLSENAISEMRTDLCVNKRLGMNVESYLRDDRGREYKQRISF